MPNNYLKSLADKHGVSTGALEKYWDEAKAAATESGRKESDGEKFYGLVTNIFKAKINKHLGLKESSMLPFDVFLGIEDFTIRKQHVT